MDALQATFALPSQKERTEQLRCRLAQLDNEVAGLRICVAKLESEMQEMTTMRLCKEGSTQADGAPSAAQLALQEDEPGPEEEKKNRDAQSMQISLVLNHSPSHQGIDVQQLTSDVLTPLLNRRRAEARAREATQLHETSMVQMVDEIKMIEIRRGRQEAWMKQVDEQILQAQVARSLYVSRQQAAEQRTKLLGEELSKAYDTINQWARQRLEVEKAKAVNEGLNEYLHAIAEAESTTDFPNNRKEVCDLLEECRNNRELHATLDMKLENLQDKQGQALELLDKVDELLPMFERLTKLWSMVPAAVRSHIFFSGATADTRVEGFPGPAIDKAQAAIVKLTAGLQQYSRTLASATS
jgi:GGDEF domain-containing protein